ncbi:MAG: LPP20 family lipoprotein [Treponema sp.]|nr:LPP20 family lipoprotein [Treponema sp.]
MRKVKFFGAVCLLFAGSFAFAAKKSAPQAMPEWVNVPSAVYPNASYITSVGYASDRDSAEIKALQGIAATFGQSVKSETEASQRMAQAKADGKVATASVNTFSQNISRSVDVDSLIGVEVKEFWLEQSTSTWYAIAVLDREKAAQIYGEMIKKNASAIKTLFSSGAEDKVSFEGYAVYDFAEDIAIENENHLKKVSVIKPVEVDSLKQYCPSSKNYHAKKIEIAKQIPICITVENDVNGRIAAVFQQTISAAGFRGTFDKSARYQLSATVTFERSDTTDGKTVRCRYNIESHILDLDNGQKLAPFSLTGRESHVDFTEAKNRAVKAIESKVKDDFAKSFAAFLKNLVAE